MLSHLHMSVYEPVTVITNCIMAAAGISLGIVLLRYRADNRRRLLWGIGFLAVGAAALFGAVFHGSGAYLDEPARNRLWSLTAAQIGMAMGFMTAAGLAGGQSRHGRNTRWLMAGGVVSAIGVLVQQSDLSLSALNHNDLYHCIQTFALFLFFRCAWLTR